MKLEKLKEKAADAKADAERAARAFKATPSAQTLADKEITAQLAANADEAVAREEEGIASAELAAKRTAFAATLERASVANWQTAAEPKLEAITKAAANLRALYAELVAMATEQGRASSEAARLGSELGEQLTRHHAPLAQSHVLEAVRGRLQTPNQVADVLMLSLE